MTWRDIDEACAAEINDCIRWLDVTRKSGKLTLRERELTQYVGDTVARRVMRRLGLLADLESREAARIAALADRARRNQDRVCRQLGVPF